MIGQLVLIAAATLATCIAVLLIAGRIARHRLAGRLAPRGDLVDVGGYRLHLVARGTRRPGRPAIVLEGGTWAPAATWGPLQDELARDHFVVAHDRAGLGWSDPSPRPRTPVVMAEELHALLRTAGIPGPYVLVGHSFGGTIARVFAHRHLDEVAGVVLLDGAHEAQFERFPEPLRAMNARMARVVPFVLRVVRLLGHAGLLALRPSAIPADLGPLPADDVAAIRARLATAPRILATMARELTELEAGNAEVRAQGIDSLGDLPLVVVSHGRPEGVPPAFGPEVVAAYEAAWQAMQAEQAALSTRGRRIVAEGVGHNVHAEAPALVVAAIGEVLAAAGIASAA